MTFFKKLLFSVFVINFLFISQSMGAVGVPDTDTPSPDTSERSFQILKLFSQLNDEGIEIPKGSCSKKDLHACCSDFKGSPVEGCKHSCGTLCSEAKADCDQDCPNGSTEGHCTYCKYLSDCHDLCKLIKVACDCWL